jgi:hypothetical protein
MAGEAAERRAILVMDLALEDPAAPAARLGRDRRPRRRPVAEARRQRPVRERRAGDPLDRDPEQDEVDVGIDGRAGPPLALQDEGPEPRRVAAIGVDRLDRGEEGAVGEAVAEGQPPLGRLEIILAKVRDRVGQRPVEVEPRTSDARSASPARAPGPPFRRA